MNFPKKILAIRLSSIGDIILTSPLYRIIKKRYPQTELHVITKKEFSSLLINNPSIDKVFEFDSTKKGNLQHWKKIIKTNKYDFIADLHNNFRSFVLSADYPPSKIKRLKKFKRERFLLVKFKKNIYPFIRPVPLRYMDVFGHWELLDDGLGTELFWDQHTANKLNEMLPDMNQFIAIAPGAAHETKRWPLDRFCMYANKMYELEQKAVVILGGPKELKFYQNLQQLLKIPYINLIGKLSLMETAFMISKAALLLSNDSGLMHMAGAVKTPVVALFGSTVRELGFFPFRHPNRVLEVLDLKCRPCSHVGKKKCPQKHFSCMKDITVDMAVKASLQLLRETKNK